VIIYKAENNINGKIYIGQTKHELAARITAHVKQNRFYFQKALNKYGLQSFTMAIIDEADSKKMLNEKEIYWVKFYNCLVPIGYNCTSGGGGMSDPSEITREKISKARIGKPGGMRGKHHSEESKQKMRKPCTEERKEKLRGRHHSEETIQKMKSVVRSEEFKQNLRGKKHSDETKKKMSGRIPWNKGQSNPYRGKKQVTI